MSTFEQNNIYEQNENMPTPSLFSKRTNKKFKCIYLTSILEHLHAHTHTNIIMTTLYPKLPNNT